MVELDVAWTGDLVGALMSTLSASSGTPATAATIQQPAAAMMSKPAADLVAFNIQKADPGWRWFAVRNRLNDTSVWRSYRHAARLSRRLLLAIAREMRAGHVQSDEATAASVCKQNADWCVVDDSWQPGHPVIGWDRESGEVLYRWELLIGAERWARIVAADEAEMRQCGSRETVNGGSGEGAAGSTGASCVPGRLYHKLKW